MHCVMVSNHLYLWHLHQLHLVTGTQLHPYDYNQLQEKYMYYVGFHLGGGRGIRSPLPESHTPWKVRLPIGTTYNPCFFTHLPKVFQIPPPLYNLSLLHVYTCIVYVQCISSIIYIIHVHV